MKLHILAPIGAALLLVGCDSSPDKDLGSEALSMDDVVAGAADLDLQVVPGEYRSTAELIEFSLPGLAPQAQQMAESRFAQGAGGGHSYCVTEEMGAEGWLSNMNESDCTVTRFENAGGTLNATLQCTDAEGLNGRVDMTGTAAGERADMEMQFTQVVPDMGEGTIRMRVVSERIGDCG